MSRHVFDEVEAGQWKSMGGDERGGDGCWCWAAGGRKGGGGGLIAGLLSGQNPERGRFRSRNKHGQSTADGRRSARHPAMILGL
jgi:hypothetical protein